MRDPPANCSSARTSARGLIGFRTEFLTETRGSGIMHANARADECVEVTPDAVRLRKVLLNAVDRVKQARSARKE